MTDELEERLRRFVPRPPDAGLRERVLAAAEKSRHRVTVRPIDWGLLAVAATLLLAAAATRPPVRTPTPTPDEEARRQAVELVASMLDGNDAAQTAERLVSLPEPRLPLAVEPR